jgi:hypothetical protein
MEKRYWLRFSQSFDILVYSIELLTKHGGGLSWYSERQ